MEEASRSEGDFFDLNASVAMSRDKAAAILRKSKVSPLDPMDRNAIDHWSAAFDRFVKRLGSIDIGAVVLDYDGTLCGMNDRFSGPPALIVKELERLIDSGIVIGIATGRGDSAGIDLRKTLRRDHWDSVLVGYYNGADIGPLSDTSLPDRNGPIDPSLEQLIDRLEKGLRSDLVSNLIVRPRQIIVEPSNVGSLPQLRLLVIDALSDVRTTGVKMFESSNSIDIIAPGVSKLNVVNELKKRIPWGAEILCIGDKGAMPGNDHELLSTPFSLSVDTVSPDPDSCWNLASSGLHGVEATYRYLSSIQCETTCFKFRLSEYR